MTGKKLDFLTCISATDSMFSQVAFARKCLDSLGQPYSDARLAVAIGESETREIPERWRPHFHNIEVSWVDAFDDPELIYFAQHFERYNLIRPDADLTILCDADVCLFRPIDTLIDEICNNPCVAGVMAHYHFPINGVRGDPNQDWLKVSRAVLGRDIEMPYRYLFGHRPFPNYPLVHLENDRPASPFYVNLGVLIAPPDMIQAIGTLEKDYLPQIRKLMPSWFGSQIATALACDTLGIPTRSLPVRYNYPSREETHLLYPEELSQIAFFHYLEAPGFNFHRSTLFADPTAFYEFVEHPKVGIEEVFRQNIVRVTQGTYPFADNHRKRAATCGH